MINYGLILLMFSPVLFLSLFAMVKDRFVPERNSFRLQTWPLWLAAVAVALFTCFFVVQSLWNIIPILRNYVYSPLNWEIVILAFNTFFLICMYYVLHKIYNVRITEIFDLKVSHLLFILKICGILAGLNVLGIYTLGINLLAGSGGVTWGVFSSTGLIHFLLYAVNTALIDPLLEESIFRGLLYTPLYRKVGRGIAVGLCSLVWTFLHFHFSSVFPYAGTFIQGLLLGWLYSRSGSLLHPIVFHMFLNSWRVIR